jgi:hypothetical protein
MEIAKTNSSLVDVRSKRVATAAWKRATYSYSITKIDEELLNTSWIPHCEMGAMNETEMSLNMRVYGTAAVVQLYSRTVQNLRLQRVPQQRHFSFFLKGLGGLTFVL